MNYELCTMDNYEFKSLKGLRVLVVEDNFISQRLIHHILEQWHVSADLASNGQIALEMVSKDVYDVVLMDLMMPVLNGYDAAMAIRSMEGYYYQNLPIFACSTTPEELKVMASGMYGSICKTPIDRVELYQKISPYLKQTHNS
ncbi:MAG: response regulator [Bacteroidota bacterium]